MRLRLALMIATLVALLGLVGVSLREKLAYDAIRRANPAVARAASLAHQAHCILSKTNLDWTPWRDNPNTMTNALASAGMQPSVRNAAGLLTNPPPDHPWLKPFASRVFASLVQTRSSYVQLVEDPSLYIAPDTRLAVLGFASDRAVVFMDDNGGLLERHFKKLPAARSPSLIGHRVHVADAELAFTLPRNWLLRQGKTVHLTPDELRRVAQKDHEWDRVYSAMINAALPFHRCLGEFNDRYRYDYLSLRIYLVGSKSNLLEDMAQRALEAGLPLPSVRPRFGRPGPDVQMEVIHGHPTAHVRLPVWFHDYGGTAIVSLTPVPRREGTFVFVFMYSDYSSTPFRELQSILGSLQLLDAATG